MCETPASVTGLLALGGPVARRLPGFVPRPPQLELAAAIEQALADGRHLVAEAGTGTGKSFAYLLPAAAWADRHQGQGPVVISTRTIALQEQLEHKDLPFLHAVLPFEWSSVTAIGRGNYVCLRRMHLARREQHLFEDLALRRELEAIVAWSVRSRDGTRFELDPPPSAAAWEEVQAEHGNCLHRACPHFEQCHWQRARRRMQTAQVLVVNHSLYLADLALRIAGAAYLPQHRVVVFDEAHHLERVATESLGLRLGPRTVPWHLRRLHGRRNDQSLLAPHGPPAARTLCEEAHLQHDAFFAGLEARLARAAARDGLTLGDERLDEPLTPVLLALAEQVANAALAVEQVDVRMELQADCLAGVWSHSTQRRNLLEENDVEEAMNAAAAVGDDRIQTQATGTVTPETDRIEGWFSPVPAWWTKTLQQSGFVKTEEPNGLSPCFKRFSNEFDITLLENHFYYTMGDSDLF